MIKPNSALLASVSERINSILKLINNSLLLKILLILLAVVILLAVIFIIYRLVTAAVWEKRKKLRQKLMSLEKSDEPITITVNNIKNGDETIEAAGSQILGTRESQQDSFYVSSRSVKFDLINTSYLAAAVCDGMGGLSSGEAASTLAVDCIKKSFGRFINSQDRSIPDMLRETALEANRTVYNYSIDECGGAPCGTTMVFALLENNNLYWTSVGDSRIYVIRDNQIVQITNDHNYAYTLENKVKQGLMTREEAMNEHNREALISFIGIPELDIIDLSINPIKLLKGDVVLLCSDGLTKIMTDMQICEFVNSHKDDIEELAELLPLRASDMHTGSQDNTTAAVIYYK